MLVDEKDKEANERKKRQAEAQALASNSTPSVSSGGKKRKANQQQANPPSKTPRHQNSQSISAAPQVIPSSPVLSAIPGPVDPAPSSPAALPLLPNHIDPFLSPATSPNMFSNTRVPSGPSSTSTLHPGPTVNHSLATPVASSSANCAPFTPTRGHAVPATSLSTFAPPITDYLPQTPTGRRYGIAQYSRTPLASSPTVMASAHHRNFATIHLPLSDESASLERKDNDKKAIGELMRNIWNTHFPNSPVTTRMKSKAKADRLLAKAGKKWIAPPGIDVNIDLYEKNKSADKVRILLDGLRRGLVNIVDI